MRLISSILATACATVLLLGGCGGSNAGADAGGGTAGGAGGEAGGGGSGGATGTAGTTGAGGRGGGGGVGGAGGGVSCGTTMCGSNQVCVQPSCGGGAAVCLPLGDAGQCPAGWTMTDCPNGPGCVPPPCAPPPAHCVDLPDACGGTPACGCLPANICTQPNGQYGGSCASVSAGRVLCVSLAG